MTRHIEFQTTLWRSRPFDHGVDVFVTAEVKYVEGDPGSISVGSGWEIQSYQATDNNGAKINDPVDDLDVRSEIEMWCSQLTR